METTRALQLEVKTVQDLTHDHIARFIGICIDPKHQYIVTEYCPKGSLQDILQNEEIKLDTMFKHSIMHDIAKVKRLAGQIQRNISCFEGYATFAW